ncbi:MAG: hypothetical protein WD898_00105 [Candidatus Paceibacterota bacterium]
MTPSERKRKQFIVALVFFLILGGFGFLIYGKVNPAPTPTPISPTANLSPIQVTLSELISVENTDYDFVAKVTNPNTGYGSPEVVYEVSFFNSSNAQIFSKTGSFYILPGQTKYVVDSPIRLPERATRAVMDINSVDWQELDPLAMQGVPLLARNTSYTEILNSGLFSRANGSILNNSDFDLGRVDVMVVLLNSQNTPVAVNRTEINTFLARTTRGFEVSWFAPFVGQVSRTDVEANTNIFQNSNFLRQYGGQERFKQLF